ncbi:MAG TPA: hypothetical protein VNH42_01785 [Mariprofundaceae bacterium]|nr:hypothetical protein [Mariprofundaceae bacterium]
MSGNHLLSYLGHIQWRADFHWYFSHLDIAHLIGIWQQGQPFSHDDWMSVAALGASFSVLLLLACLLIISYRNTLFRAWLDHKRSQLTHRPPRESRTKIEPKINGYPMLQQVYNLHRLAMYDNALSKYKMALQAAPFDLNTYLVGVKIVSEMDTPNKAFVQFLVEAMYNLRSKHPAVWNELARYGQETAPALVLWERAGESSGDARALAAAQLS